MENLLIAVIAGLLILLASVASVELGISVALIEISLGVIAGNFLGLSSPPWMDFLASFGSILLTFLAGAEVDPRAMQEKLKESALIGGVSFAAPFLGAWLFCAWVLGWSTSSAQIAGVALSTTSLAVVYAVLVETGLTLTPLGKLIMASTFVTDFGTALALALLFVRPTWWLVPFLGVSVLAIWIMIALQPWFFSRYGARVIEPEIKGAVAALLGPKRRDVHYAAHVHRAHVRDDLFALRPQRRHSRPSAVLGSRHRRRGERGDPDDRRPALVLAR